jgi:hypothetical protein
LERQSTMAGRGYGINQWPRNNRIVVDFLSIEVFELLLH